MSIYRIKYRLIGYEPQMRYTVGTKNGTKWFPLSPDGYWLEPESFSYGVITRHMTMTKDDAKAAILKAKSANSENMRLHSLRK